MSTVKIPTTVEKKHGFGSGPVFLDRMVTDQKGTGGIARRTMGRGVVYRPPHTE